jgi:hypothetical protein
MKKRRIKRPAKPIGRAKSNHRITNVNPLPKQIATRLYEQPDDDADAILTFIAAQQFRN